MDRRRGRIQTQDGGAGWGPRQDPSAGPQGPGVWVGQRRRTCEQKTWSDCCCCSCWWWLLARPPCLSRSPTTTVVSCPVAVSSLRFPSLCTPASAAAASVKGAAGHASELAGPSPAASMLLLAGAPSPGTGRPRVRVTCVSSLQGAGGPSQGPSPSPAAGQRVQSPVRTRSPVHQM